MINSSETARDQKLTSQWSKIDADNNGGIGQSELAAYAPIRVFEPVRTMHKNSSGTNLEIFFTRLPIAITAIFSPVFDILKIV